MIKKLSISLLIILFCLVIGGKVYVHSCVQTYLEQPLKLEKNELFTIKRGVSLHSALNNMAQRHWITSSWVARFLHRLEPELTAIKAGTYQLAPDETLKQALDDLIAGNEHQFSITFVEGSRFSEWRQKLASEYGLEHTLKGDTEKQIAVKLGIEKNKLEGLFLAETYHFTAGTKDIDILKRAHTKLEAVLSDAWQGRKKGLSLKSPYEALILASIIEKETSIESERKQIASVFINRLKKGMRLQTDPTVIYGMGDKYHGNIRKKDLLTPTAYNTYVIKGLPPTPIAMPGKLSIQAALQPDETHYLYFVASGKGGHVFSNTLAEHNRAVHRYLKQLKKKNN
ncbi:endolytic transglycosylase MltG [Vibrio salinus]|uniref:endolytic transglycosylase MltG n=1 Tax=Vibrio salinus TaxID=2899784 RepID=UPI001E28A170|nr:endolytic transglycosylase MltG [Vibrio salinus]MCE0494626.1 endolytic transglycosylase MltG [Vibrio salinus]